MYFCSKCGKQLEDSDKFCSNCGAEATLGLQDFPSQAATTVESNMSNNFRDRGYRDTFAGDFSYLPDYYQKEFLKIQESNGTYSGKWNWAAFFFGAFWAFSKGLWASVVIVIVGSLLTSGLIGFIYWIIYGFRGNYMYYTLVTKKKQSIF